MKNEKMWAVFVKLSNNMWWKKYETLKDGGFDEDVWDDILKEMSEKKFNTIVLDVGDGVKYDSHPEISLRDAWDRQKVHNEIQKAKEFGIKIIPKLNFSTTHDMWLGDYERMVSSKIYYEVCRDLIYEIYEIFEHPEYIHLGMDEETESNGHSIDYIVLRKGELIWHDLKFYCDCVRETGATPWLWADFLFNYPQEFRKHIKPDKLLLSPWQYSAMYEEHFTPIANRQKDIDYYWKGKYKDCHFTYVEEDPMCVKYREQSIPGMLDGYCYVPTVSYSNECAYNFPDTLRWFREKAPDDKVVGFLTAPWGIMSNKQLFTYNLELMAAARKEYYPDR